VPQRTAVNETQKIKLEREVHKMHSRFKITTAAFAGQHPTKMQAGRLCRLRQVPSAVIQPDNCQSESVHSPPVGYGVKASHTAESRRFQPENKKTCFARFNTPGQLSWPSPHS